MNHTNSWTRGLTPATRLRVLSKDSTQMRFKSASPSETGAFIRGTPRWPCGVMDSIKACGAFDSGSTPGGVIQKHFLMLKTYFWHVYSHYF